MWRFEPVGGIEHRAELALVLTEAVATKASLAVFGFEPEEPGQIRGTGFAFSASLNADYAYLPASAAGSLIVLPLTFQTKLVSITVGLMSWPAKQAFGRDRVRGALLTVVQEEKSLAITRPGRWVG